MLFNKFLLMMYESPTYITSGEGSEGQTLTLSGRQSCTATFLSFRMAFRISMTSSMPMKLTALVTPVNIARPIDGRTFKGKCALKSLPQIG